MLQKLIKHRTGDRSPAKKNGHSGHWQCIYTESSSARLASFVEQMVRRSSPAYREDGVAIYYSLGDQVRAAALLRGNSLRAAFPQVVGGPEWQVELTRIIPWRNGLEGQLAGRCMGADVCFFDTSYCQNRRVYRVGETYSFRMGALAYRLGPAHDLEVEMEGGGKVSLKGAHAFMPAGKADEGADIDDYWFHSPLDSPMISTIFNNVELRGYPITLALPRDFAMSLTLYAASHVEAPGTRDIAPDADVQGYLWLQGYHE